jgi:hypothetical protein
MHSATRLNNMSPSGQRSTSIIAIVAAARLASLAVQTRADRRSPYITLQVSLLSLLLRSALRHSRYAVTRYLVDNLTGTSNAHDMMELLISAIAGV